MLRRSIFSPLLRGELVCLVHLLNTVLVRCQAVNRSIDDTLGDSVTGQRPLFLPSISGVWEDNTCKGCALQPPTSNAFDGTYTAATYNPGLNNISITFEFTGTAVYVFFILANALAPGITATTAASFILDGFIAGSFTHSPDSSAPAFQFNALVFSETGLENISHQLVINTVGYSDDIWVNFDYALYTLEAAVTSSLSPTSSSLVTLSTPTSSTPTPSSPLSSPSLSSPSSTSLFSPSLSSSSSSSSSPSSPSLSSPSPAPLLPSSSISLSFSLTSNLATSTSPSSSKSSENSSKSTHPIGAIVGAVVGGLVVFGALVVGLFLCCRHGRRHRVFAQGHETPVPFSRNLVNDDSHFLPDPSISHNTDPLSMAPVTAHQTELKETHQQELECQMEVINDEIEELKTEARERTEGVLSSRSPSSAELTSPSGTLQPMRTVRGADENVDVGQLQNQIQIMTEQIAFLQSQHRSARVQGLSEEPPPGYFPRLRSNSSTTVDR
ncbi:hypothetical protein GYMLUDRAFT_245909 [Collybiopsis luxurians FD-317 M1]|uniref:Uncharacterized protein n=1 Tax=Collybiopsis luxurians FD-317 M1 TaxID=944289 RepID=A0A0D0C8K8_9AGAR|nr:hypothetical protein GYMLUDRAFT_245909 [Collybiopsis luxurians FD-317 M1]